MTRYNEWDDSEIWNAKYENCDCDEIESLEDAQKIIDQFILAHPNYALTSEDVKVRKRATELFKKRQEFKTKVASQLQTLNQLGINNKTAILELPQLKKEVLALSELLADISDQNICITQLTKDFIDK